MCAASYLDHLPLALKQKLDGNEAVNLLTVLLPHGCQHRRVAQPQRLVPLPPAEVVVLWELAEHVKQRALLDPRVFRPDGADLGSNAPTLCNNIPELRHLVFEVLVFRLVEQPVGSLDQQGLLDLGDRHKVDIIDGHLGRHVGLVQEALRHELIDGDQQRVAAQRVCVAEMTPVCALLHVPVEE